MAPGLVEDIVKVLAVLVVNLRAPSVISNCAAAPGAMASSANAVAHATLSRRPAAPCPCPMRG
jgi:hypothetical protein